MRVRVSPLRTTTWLFLLFSAMAWPQSRTPAGGVIQPGSSTPGMPSDVPADSDFNSALSALQPALLVDVFSENRVLDRQAVVKAVNKESQREVWETTNGNSEAAINALKPGLYEIEVTAVGYLPSNLEVTVQDPHRTNRVRVELKKDPSAIDLSVPDRPQMSAAARKAMSQGIADLRSGKLKQASKHLGAASERAPSDPELKFLLGYLCFQKKDFKQAETYLIDASTLDSHNAQALALLGRLQIQREDYAAARKTLEQAITFAPEYWMAHSLLADTYLKQQEYEKAREQAQLAIDTGKGAGTSAEIALGQALEKLGRDQEALQAYSTFLAQSPSSPVAAQARHMLDELQQRVPTPSGDSQPAPKIAASSSLPDAAALLAASQPEFSARTWGPPNIDDVKSIVATGVTCPTEQVLHDVGERTRQLMDNIGQFSAIEDLLHEDLDELGHPTGKTALKFNYVAAISEPRPGDFSVNEFRSPDTNDFPGQIATRGLPALAFIFHPHERDDFHMVCEGLGDWHGEATWLVRFQQREDRIGRVQEYKINGVFYPVKLKGRAWISARTFNIVHLESDLVKPMPEIKLLGEHLAVDYAPQLFQKKKVQLWLPKSAEMYFDFRGHHYYRRHNFDHFMLFSVDTEEKPYEAGVNRKPPGRQHRHRAGEHPPTYSDHGS